MTTTIKANGIGDVLAAIPAMAGYTPVESLVVLPMQGTRSCGLFRFDLPAFEKAGQDTETVAMSALGFLARLDGVDGALFVVYSNNLHEVYASLADTLGHCAALTGFDSRAAFVCADGWGEFGDVPNAPHTLPTLDMPEALAAFRSQSEVEETPPLSRERIEAITAATPRYSVALSSTAVAVALEALEHDPADMHASTLGALGALIGMPMFRDVALSAWCHGAEVANETLAYQIAFNKGDELTAPDTLFLMGEGERPNPKNLEHALTVVRYLSAVQPFHAAALATAAWLCWALGRTSQAVTYAERALKVEEIGLAQIVHHMSMNSMLPAWAFTK